jgi:hypothetical protein
VTHISPNPCPQCGDVVCVRDRLDEIGRRAAQIEDQGGRGADAGDDAGGRRVSGVGWIDSDTERDIRNDNRMR